MAPCNRKKKPKGGRCYNKANNSRVLREDGSILIPDCECETCCRWNLSDEEFSVKMDMLESKHVSPWIGTPYYTPGGCPKCGKGQNVRRGEGYVYDSDGNAYWVGNQPKKTWQEQMWNKGTWSENDEL